MTRDEFQKIVDEVTGGEYYPPQRKNKSRGIEARKGYYGPKLKLKVEWMTGGAWGGNCWDDSDPSSYGPDPEKEPEFEVLDEILERVAPTIGFLQYKTLMQRVKYDTRTVYEYYGNHTSYGIKEILIEDVWEFLQEKGYV
jgi:hypothetical protein